MDTMDIAAFSQLGIGVATLVILWIVVRYFIEALTKKDDYISEIVKEFNITINNHINHSTQAADRTTKALTALTRAISKLTKDLDNRDIRDHK